MVRLFDQIAVATKDASAVNHQNFAPRAGVEGVVDLYFGGVLMSSM